MPRSFRCAPLHQPHNPAVIRAMLAARPDVPQVACFDTAFHRSQPAIAQSFAIPRKYTEAGVRRYGFHGVSYEYVTGRLKEVAPDVASGRVILAHLGNGASLCATKNGKSVASTMGFTAVDGLMMGTRCGALDPGVLVHLIDKYGMGARELEDLIYRKSGLLGVSGISSDMRALRGSPDPAAKEAITLFVYRVQREIGHSQRRSAGSTQSFSAAALARTMRPLAPRFVLDANGSGVGLDAEANGRGDLTVSASASRVRCAGRSDE